MTYAEQWESAVSTARQFHREYAWKAPHRSAMLKVLAAIKAGARTTPDIVARSGVAKPNLTRLVRLGYVRRQGPCRKYIYTVPE